MYQSFSVFINHIHAIFREEESMLGMGGAGCSNSAQVDRKEEAICTEPVSSASLLCNVRE